LKEKNLYRSLVTSDATGSTTIKRGGKIFTSFCCNDYFSLSQNPAVKNAAIAAIKKYGLGGRASRYVSGNNSLYKKLEKKIARMKNCDDAVIFSSGYAAAIGAVPALVGEGDLIVADRLIHASLIAGAKLSEAKLMRFRHNDLAHCRKILAENRKNFAKCLIITETVFSMDGDVGEVPELLKLAQEFDCLFLSDDAHGLGLNLFEKKKIAAKNHLQMGTFSKAAGALGGYICGDKILIDYLRNFAKSAIYSTALPPSVLAGSLASLKIISEKKLAKKILENAAYFCELLNLPKPQSAIVVMLIYNDKKTVEIAKKIAQKGFLISAIRPPTVEPGKARWRITFCAEHKKSQIKKLAEELMAVKNL
jgi:8-amino-7-oxononanoate synthase